ncbi:MAG: hypothetical protein LBL97_05305 [Prevotellaceae bacterium]|nr:hypothetical protein [Prevotellaceae bacterium]
MKTSKVFLLGIALLWAGGGTVRAQITPEAMIGQCPDLPSVSTLIAYSMNSYLPNDRNDRAAEQAIEAFRKQISTLRERAKQAGEQISAAAETAGRSDAERIVKQQTGKSVAELRNMSKAQQEAMGMQLVAQQLQSVGLGNMSLDQLKALEGKNEEEVMAAMSSSGVTFGGLTPDELKAMEKMSDADKLAYMQQGDRMQRMQNASDPWAVKKGQAAAQKAQSQLQVIAEIKQINERWAAIDLLMEKEIQEVQDKLHQISKKYAPQYARGDIYESGTAAEIRAAQTNDTKVRTAQYTEQAPIWRNHIAQMMSRIKNKMADASRMDELQAQTMSSSGMTDLGKVNMQSYAYTIADDYLKMATQVTTF